ncbi:MAG: SPFH domain-containing protein [Anaerolineae bacterium]|nr:SPFH domain-containing protein [Anaerolineae bacterium]
MIQKWDLNVYERLVVKEGNQYKLKGPGTVWLLSGFGEVLDKIFTGVKGQVFEIAELSTAKGIQVSAKIQLSYKVELDLLGDMLCQVVSLNAGGWQTTLNLQIESILRKLVSQYSWQDLTRPMIQKRIERHLGRIVSEAVASIGIRIVGCSLVNVKLPEDLLKAQLQSAVLKSYADTFGERLPQAMSNIARLQLLNAMQDQGKVQVVLTSSDFSNSPVPRKEPAYYLSMEQPSLFIHPERSEQSHLESQS